jgi:hypothetical protein
MEKRFKIMILFNLTIDQSKNPFLTIQKVQYKITPQE